MRKIEGRYFMKHILLLLVFCFVGAVLAVDKETYTWIGVGCRDLSMSEESHVAKSMSSNPMNASSAVLNINKDGTARMSSVVKGEVKTNSSTYEKREDRIVIFSEDGEEEIFYFRIVGDTLVIPENYESVSEENCGSDKIYVYVLGRVN